MPLLIALIVIPLMIWLFRIFMGTSTRDIIQFFKAMGLFALGAGILAPLLLGRWVVFFVALIVLFPAIPRLKMWFHGTDPIRLEPPSMDRAHALKILGLTGNPTKSAIQKSYTHLMQKHHPDAGGTDHFACQLNAARDFLIQNM